MIKKIPVQELVQQGYLQELNRRFLHPLGLALMVSVDRDGNWSLADIWDCRDDPEGIYFEDGVDAEKFYFIDEQIAQRRPLREKALGYWTQPLWTSEETQAAEEKSAVRQSRKS